MLSPVTRLFPQQQRVEELARRAGSYLRVEELCRVRERGREFPVHGLVLGSPRRRRPTFGLFAGVHGLERVGTEIALTWLETLVARLQWDKELRRVLRKSRIVSIPMVNPAGVYFGHRGNSAGVDLMRNAPVEASAKVPLLVGGHRLGPWLWWYRGRAGELEPEARALIDFVRREIFPARAAVTLDLHSGFGLRDRLWYPYARSAEPFADLLRVRAFADMLDRSLPYHVYRIEQQSESYCTHGDLWDYLHDSYVRERGAEPMFLPWTLEIGSWTWVRKNPRQLLRADGVFNPIKPHRMGRAMRRHLGMLEFFWRATRNHRRWEPAAPGEVDHDALRIEQATEEGHASTREAIGASSEDAAHLVVYAPSDRAGQVGGARDERADDPER